MPGDAEKELACNTFSVCFVILVGAAPCCRHREQRMTRRSFMDALPANQKAKAIAVLRANRHQSLDWITAALSEQVGVETSRSAVHRALAKLNAYDRRSAATGEGTVVTIVERATGEIRLVTTGLPASTVEGLIRQN